MNGLLSANSAISFAFLRQWIAIAAELGKVRVSAAVAATAAAGYFLAGGAMDARMAGLALGVFILSCGACALNQYHERDADARMERTRRRPIPSGKISPSQTLLAASMVVDIGACALLFGFGPMAGGLGIVAVFWYNHVYTPAKRATPYAVFAGAPVGAVPPLIGWTAADGSIFDPRILAVALFFMTWQIPHFWLIQLRWGGDYERAGFPSLGQRLSGSQIARFIRASIAATALAGCLMPAVWIGTSSYVANLCATLPLVAAALMLLFRVFRVFRGHDSLLPESGEDHGIHEEDQKAAMDKAFHAINAYAALALAALCLGRFLDSFPTNLPF